MTGAALARKGKVYVRNSGGYDFSPDVLCLRGFVDV